VYSWILENRDCKSQHFQCTHGFWKTEIVNHNIFRVLMDLRKTEIVNQNIFSVLMGFGKHCKSQNNSSQGLFYFDWKLILFLLFLNIKFRIIFEYKNV